MVLRNISDMDANVNMGDGVLTSNAQDNLDSIIISSIFEASCIDTTTLLPPFHTPIPTSLHHYLNLQLHSFLNTF